MTTKFQRNVKEPTYMEVADPKATVWMLVHPKLGVIAGSCSTQMRWVWKNALDSVKLPRQQLYAEGWRVAKCEVYLA